MNSFNPFSILNSWVLLPLILWVAFWKFCSLWFAAKNNQKKWFIALIIFNTFGILEIIYIFFILKKRWSDVKEILTLK